MLLIVESGRNGGGREGRGVIEMDGIFVLFSSFFWGGGGVTVRTYVYYIK